MGRGGKSNTKRNRVKESSQEQKETDNMEVETDTQSEQYDEEEELKRKPPKRNAKIKKDEKTNKEASDEYNIGASTSNTNQQPINGEKAHQQSPMVIKNLNQSQIRDKLTKFQGKYTFIASRNAIKIMPNSKQDFTEIKAALTEKKVEFHIHPSQEEATTKFVLHGLEQMNEKKLLNLLESVNITPLKIRPLNLKNAPTNSSYAIYIVYFKKTDKIKLQKLNEIKKIRDSRVKWNHYNNPNKGPTQCKNCCEFGHGAQGCFNNPKCWRCAESHKAEDCINLYDAVTQLPKNKVDTKDLKCLFCKGNHTALNKDCLERKKMIEKLNKERETRLKRSGKYIPPTPQQQNTTTKINENEENFASNEYNNPLPPPQTSTSSSYAKIVRNTNIAAEQQSEKPKYHPKQTTRNQSPSTMTPRNDYTEKVLEKYAEIYDLINSTNNMSDCLFHIGKILLELKLQEISFRQPANQTEATCIDSNTAPEETENERQK